MGEGAENRRTLYATDGAIQHVSLTVASHLAHHASLPPRTLRVPAPLDEHALAAGSRERCDFSLHGSRSEQSEAGPNLRLLMRIRIALPRAEAAVEHGRAQT